MTRPKLARRAFIGATAAAAAVIGATAEASLSRFLLSRSAEDDVFTILARHLGLTQSQRGVVRPFMERLATPGLHTESPELFQAWLARKEGYEANLEAYIVEEFLIASNYFAFQGGQVHELEVKLPALS
jgi:hypothetical protein